MLPDTYVEAMSPGTASTTFQVFGIPPINLSCSGLPAGSTCQFLGTQEMYSKWSLMKVAVTLPAGVTPANSSFTIDAQSGGLTAQGAVPLRVFSFVVEPPTSDQDWSPSPSNPPVTFPVTGASLSLGCALDGGTVCQTTGMGISSLLSH